MTQDRPDAPELLDAVAEFLVAQVRPAAPRGQHFQILVAANLCAVVAREIRAGDRPALEDLRLFGELLGRRLDEGEDLGGAVRDAQAELSRRIRAGEMDARLDALAAALAAHVSRKLAVARPGYDVNPPGAASRG